jgi:anaerobic magnesium-protoporphyrin IX monomethyl ester cyclase
LRVLLAYRCSDEGRSSAFERLLPVGLCSLAAVLHRRGHDVSAANYSDASPAEIERHILASRPDVVGISVFTFNRSASFDLARTARRLLPAAIVVAGGPHVSHLHASVLDGHPEIDYVAIGEGEETLARLLDRLAAGEDAGGLPGLAWRADGVPRSSGWPDPIADLDRLPFPFEGFRGYGVDPRSQFMIVVTSRGCPARCAFCNTPQYWGSRIRFRSVDHVLGELRALREKFGLLEVSFRDDTFTVDRHRVLELCRRMSEEGLGYLWDCQSRVSAVDEERLVAMRRAGCVHIQYGVESGSSRILERLAKGIDVAGIERAARATRRAGIEFSVYLIAGIDGEEEEDLAATEALLRRIRPHGAVVSPLAVFPGTALWEDWKRQHGLDDSTWSAGGREAIYVRQGDPASAAAIERIGRLVSSEAQRNAYGLADLREQRRRIGDCHALDLAEASLLLKRHRPNDARRVLEDLARREPRNPWAPLELERLHPTGASRGKGKAR